MRQISTAAADPFAAFHWFSAVQIPGNPLGSIVGGMEDKFLRLDQKAATAILALCEKSQAKDAGT
eukprot:12907265-Prorocentrum_lima.AAC.1